MHSLRLLRSVSSLSVQKRTLFYESSRYSVADYEKKLIAKSKEAAGLRFLLQSSPYLEEWLSAVSEQQDSVSLNVLRIGHMISFPRSATNSIQSYNSSLQSQLEQISELPTSENTNLGCLSIHIPSNVLLEEIQAKTLLTQTRLFQQKKMTANDTKIGYHLLTETLQSLRDHQVEEVGANLVASNSDFLILAVNPFTYQIAMSISQQLKSKLPIYATEVLRCHPAIPGQVSASYEYLQPHVRRFEPETPTTQNTNHTSNQNNSTLPLKVITGKGSDSLSEEERLGVHDLHMAFDRAIAMEKALLAKHPDKVSELVTACVAHNISRRYFQYLEEFDYLIESQVKPQFDKLGKAKEQDINMKSWIILHRPILNYLFSSYRSFLASKQLDLSRSIARIVSRRVMHDVHESDSESLKWLPIRLAALAKQAVNAADVGLTLTVVGKKESEIKIPPMTKEQIMEVYEEIGKVYKDYYHTEVKSTSS